MIQLDEVQSKWIEDNFHLSKSDLPTEFYDKKTLIEFLCGKGDFRGKDYLGDSMSFVEDCLQSLYSNDFNKKRFQLLFKQLNNYWTKQAEQLEYYELLANLTEMNNQFIEFVKVANDQKADYEVLHLLSELGMSKLF